MILSLRFLYPALPANPNQMNKRQTATTAIPAIVRCVTLFGLLVATGFSTQLDAATYKCTQQGRITYSDTPCSSGQQSTALPAEKPVTPDARRQSRSVQEKYHQLNQGLEAERKKREARRKIIRLRAEIRALEKNKQTALKEISEEMDSLDFNSDDIDDVVLAEFRQQELFEQQRKIESKYQLERQALQNQIDALQRQLDDHPALP